MKRNLVSIPAKSHQRTSNTEKRLKNPVKLSYEHSILDPRKSVVLNTFNFHSIKKSPQSGYIQHSSAKPTKSNPSKINPFFRKHDLISIQTPDLRQTNKSSFRSISPRTLKSSLKTQVISHKHLKKVKFEDTDSGLGKLNIDNIARRTFNNFKVSIRQSPSYLSPKETKKSPRYTVNDLINYPSNPINN
jgi:hypothetical protein